MVTALLDTSIVIDVLRQHPPAKSWLSTTADVGITQIVQLEVIEGATRKIEQQRAIRFLSGFQLVDVITSDLDWSLEQLMRFKLSHNVGMMDCLIASVSYRLQVPLYTTNLKHFLPLLGAQVQQPY
jgi:predicted nucleic acid-binding protein